MEVPLDAHIPYIFRSLSNDVLSYNFPGVVQIECMNHNLLVDKILEHLGITLQPNESIILGPNSSLINFV